MSFLSFALLLWQAIAPQTVQNPRVELPVQMGYRVNPDTVLVGQPFNLFIKVLAPKGVRFEFPLGPDTATMNGIRPIELRGEKIVSMLGDTAVALYHLVAWETGSRPLRIPEVRVTFKGQERHLPLDGASIFVHSVLPADSALLIAKPARPPIILPVFNWVLWLGLLAAAIAAVLLVWAWSRWRNRPKPPVDPYAHAQAEFARIEARHLLEDGQYTEYFTVMIDVVREYLAARVPSVRRSDTTSELLHAMNPRDGVEAVLPQLLDLADLVKFARGEVSLPEAKGAGPDLRAIVDSVEARLKAESEAAKRTPGVKERAA